jgi:hypothetical protein
MNMSHRVWRPLVALSCLVLASGAVEAAGVPHTRPLTVPVSFEQNIGQAGADVKYLSRGLGGTLFLTQNEAVWVSRGASGVGVLRMALRGAQENVAMAGEAPIATRSHYLHGNHASQWRLGAPHYAQVRAVSVYPGIDVVYRSAADARLEYDFVVAPGANLEAIRLAFTGMDGVRINEGGDLVLPVSGGELVQHAPVAYQYADGVRVPVAASFKLNADGSVGFRMAAHDRGRPLVIDPVVSFSTYLGDVYTSIKDIKVMPDGSAYLYGYTSLADLPVTAGALQGALAGGSDAYIAKLAADGTRYEFLTYLGGSGNEESGGSIGPGIAIDGKGGIYVTGRTDSVDFPLLNPLQSGMIGGTDFYVAKLDQTGSRLIYATYLGGPDSASPTGNRPSEAGPTIAVDRTGNVYIMGYTNAAGYPVVNAYQTNLAGGLDGVLTKLNARGSSMIFSTYFGGSADDKPRGIAVDGRGNALITGRVDSSDFPLARPLQGVHGGQGDIFVSRFTPAGGLDFSTFWGGANTEKGRAVTLDRRGNIYITGNTQSADFPTLNPIQGSLAGGGDMFVLGISAALDRMIYATYLGGAEDDEGSAIAVDSYSNAFVAGFTKSLAFPVVQPFQGSLAGPQDAVVVKMNARGSSVMYASPLGGSGTDESVAIGVDGVGNAYVAGTTDSTDFPLLNPLQTGAAGAFVTRVSP